MGKFRLQHLRWVVVEVEKEFDKEVMDNEIGEKVNAPGILV